MLLLSERRIAVMMSSYVAQKGLTMSEKQEERARQILAVLKRTPEGMSLKQLSEELGLRKSPYTRQIAFWCVTNKLVAKRWDNSTYPAREIYYITARGKKYAN